SMSSHIRYSSWRSSPAGWQASSEGGSAKISQPPPASTESRPSTPRKKARSASASRLKTMACTPVIMLDRQSKQVGPGPASGREGDQPAAGVPDEPVPALVRQHVVAATQQCHRLQVGPPAVD